MNERDEIKNHLLRGAGENRDELQLRFQTALQQAQSLSAVRGDKGLFLILAVVSAAAASIILVWTFGVFSSRPNDHANRHFSADEVKTALRDFEGCRYVGFVGDKAVLEVPEKDGVIQILLKAGEEFRKLKVIAFTDKLIEFESAAKVRMILKIKTGSLETAEPVKAAPLDPFVIRGHVQFGNGNPIEQGRAHLLDEHGRIFETASTDKAGDYGIRSVRKVSAVWFEVKHPLTKSSTRITVEGPWTKDATVDLDLAKFKTFALSGAVIDAKGKAVFQARPSFYGENNRYLGDAMTDENGSYSSIFSEPVTRIWVAHQSRNFDRTGFWDKDTVIDFDFSKEETIVLRGKITGRDGKPANYFIAGINANGKSLGYVRADDEGNYILEVAKPVMRVAVYEKLFSIPAYLDGLWNESAILNVNMGDMKEYVCKGKVLGLDGKPMPNVPVYFRHPEAFNVMPPTITATTDKDGNYHLSSYAPIDWIITYWDNVHLAERGPFKDVAAVNFDARDSDVFTLDIKPRFKEEILKTAKITLIPELDSKATFGGMRSVTKTDGVFRYHSNHAFKRIKCYCKELDMNIALEGSWDKTEELVLDFSKHGGFEISGCVKDEKGIALQTTVSAHYGDSGAVSRLLAYTDKSGNYRIRAGKTIDCLSITIDGVEVKRAGPFIGDAIVNFNLSESPRFKIRGKVLAPDGEAVKYGVVHALDKDGMPMNHCYSALAKDASGDYELRASGEVHGLSVLLNDVRVLVKGPWSKDTEVNVNFADFKLFRVRGLLTDDLGRPLPSLMIEARDPRGLLCGRAETDAKGFYSLRSSMEVTEIVVQRTLREIVSLKGKWNSDSEQNLDGKKLGLFVITAKALDEKGRPLVKAHFALRDDKMVLITTGSTDEKGEVRLLLSRPAFDMDINLHPLQKSIKGKWDRSADVEVVLEKEG